MREVFNKVSIVLAGFLQGVAFPLLPDGEMPSCGETALVFEGKPGDEEG